MVPNKRILNKLSGQFQFYGLTAIFFPPFPTKQELVKENSSATMYVCMHAIQSLLTMSTKTVDEATAVPESWDEIGL